MTIVTDDTWIAALEPSGPAPAFRVFSPPQSADRASGAVLTAHTEGPCSIVLSGTLHGTVPAPDVPANDAAIVLRAYLGDPQRWLTRVRGIFAFALWDSRTGVLLAVRDRLGIFPLFYARDAQGRWLVSPSLASLTAQRAVSTRLDPVVIAERLFDQWADGEETEYASIRRVLPGHVLTIDGDRVSRARYWDPAPADLRTRDGADIVDRFEQAFERAVGRAWQPGRTGIFLSGGVDSISVAAVTARLAGAAGSPAPVALSLLYADPEFHEAEIQRSVAITLGLPARQIGLEAAIDGQSATASLLEANVDWPLPTLNIWLPAFVQLAREGRALGCDVILTGGGGDEWLGVSPYLAADLIARLRFISLYRFWEKTRRSYDIGHWGLLQTCGWTFGVKPHLARLRDRAAALAGYDVDRRNVPRRMPAWIAPLPALRAAITERCVGAWRADRAKRAAAHSYYDYEARRTLDHPVVVGEIENKFHVGQRAGVRMLEPYWDAELVELLYTTHPDALGQGGYAKGLVHRLVQRALPDLPVIRQRKIALSMAYQERVRREGRQAWEQMNGVPALAAMGVVDPDKVAATVERLLSGPHSNGAWLVPYLLSVEAWVRAHG